MSLTDFSRSGLVFAIISSLSMLAENHSLERPTEKSPVARRGGYLLNWCTMRATMITVELCYS